MRSNAIAFDLDYNYALMRFRTNAPRRWVMVAIFAITMSYASVCSAMCAAGICPGELQYSSDSDGCGQMPMGHANYPQKHCSTHHPNTTVVKTDKLPSLHLQGTGYVLASNLISQSLYENSVNSTAVSLSGLAPPPTLSALNLRASILRI